MIQWYEPFTLTEWFKRVFSLINLTVVLITSVFVLTEFKYNWCERLMGNYLVSINASRPETGTIWKTGSKTAKANNNLQKIIDKKRDAKKHIQNSASFLELASGVQAGEWINLDKEQFKKLYLKLPAFAANKLIPSSKLLYYFNTSKLDRIFVEGQKDKSLKIFFLNSDNLVLEEIELDKEVFETPETGTRFIMNATLDDFEGFNNRIFTAEDFFKAMMDLSFDKINDLIDNPDMLLSKKGRITRAGIWNETQGGYIKLGFEYKDKSQTHVLIVNGREWAVWELVINLKGRSI